VRSFGSNRVVSLSRKLQKNKIYQKYFYGLQAKLEIDNV
jgi:hypothetical protein